MPISSPRLRRLDAALAALPADGDAMLLSDLDGYLAGIVLSPDPVAPALWLPIVWGDDPDAPIFVDDAEADWYARLVTEHRDAIARTLARGPGRYAPFLEIDPRHDEVLWELWIEGFETAMALHPDGWARIGASGEAAAVAALDGLVTLAAIARDASDLDRAAIDRLTEEAPALIPQWIDTLHDWRMRHADATEGMATGLRPAKPGRNDPCSCGSGRKFKRCCA